MYHEELEVIVGGRDDVGLYNPQLAITEQDGFIKETHGAYITMRVITPRDYGCNKVKYIRNKREEDVNIIGARNKNPLLESRIYTVEFDDGTLCKYAVNLII